MCDCHKIVITSPDGYLQNVYGSEIKKIHEDIEHAIANYELENDSDWDLYVDIRVSIPDHLYAMFKRIYVTEGGWLYLTNNHETARLYPPKGK